MKRCVITGAAGGIGRALAYRFAAANYAIIGIDLDAQQADHTRYELQRSGKTIEFITADLARQEDLDRVLEILEATPAIDIFIHNAGINAVGHFGDLPLSQQKAVLEVNLVAPTLLTAGLLSRQLLASRASLVFISSLSHYLSYPGAAVYAASKDGLASYARSLAISLNAHDVHVLTVFPGPTRTAHARRYSPDNRKEHRRMPPDRLANEIFQAVQARRRILVPGFGNKWFALFGRYFPALTELAMRKKILDKLDKVDDM